MHVYVGRAIASAKDFGKVHGDVQPLLKSVECHLRELNLYKLAAI
jgi:hypothetical protein